MMKKQLFILLLLTAMLLVACSDKGIVKEVNDSDKLTVYTTVYPLQYFTERIGGDHVDVKSVYPPGSDEHTFEPTQREMMALADSDLFFYIGLGLEGFVDNAEKTLKSEHVKMIATAEAITEDMMLHENPELDHDLDEGHEETEHNHDKDEGHEEAEHDHDKDEGHEEIEHDHGVNDPHVWISPVLSDALAYAIKEALIEIEPDKKADFEENFEALREDLLKLDREFLDMASKAPTKTFFVSHAAFGYIADTYGLEQVAIAGLNSQNEPSQKQLASLVKYASEHDVKYVLFEQNVSSKLTDVIRKEIGAESLMLHNLGVLTTDDIKNKEDYFSLMEMNIATLEKALSNQ